MADDHSTTDFKFCKQTPAQEDSQETASLKPHFSLSIRRKKAGSTCTGSQPFHLSYNQTINA